MTPSVDQHVRRLEIAVQHAAVVCRGKAGTELARELECLVRRQAADPPEQRGEILAVDVLHREEVLPVDVADVVDAAHVRMRDLPGEPDFLMEAGQPVGAVHDLPRQELESDGLPELQVFGSIDFAHAAAAE